MSVQVVYKNSKKIANSKVQAVFTGENFTMSEVNSLSKAEIIKLKKLINLKKINSNNLFHLNLDSLPLELPKLLDLNIKYLLKKNQ